MLGILHDVSVQTIADCDLIGEYCCVCLAVLRASDGSYISG